jgi:hypothetical protein
MVATEAATLRVMSGCIPRARTACGLARIMHHASRFFAHRLAHARRRSVRLDRCASTRCATHWGLLCLVGGSLRHPAPWLRGWTASGQARRRGTVLPPGGCECARYVRSRGAPILIRRSRSVANSQQASGFVCGIAGIAELFVSDRLCRPRQHPTAVRPILTEKERWLACSPRLDAPASTASITGSRNPSEYGFGIAWVPRRRGGGA